MIKDAYPFTRSVENAVAPGSGSGQVFDPQLHLLLCGGFEEVPESEFVFDELNACYRATPRCSFNCSAVWPEFDWMVRVEDLLEIYAAVAAEHGGWCELDTWFGLPPGPTPGFHATNLDRNWWRWIVHADEQCGAAGCECDGWVHVAISDSGQLVIDESPGSARRRTKVLRPLSDGPMVDSPYSVYRVF